MEDSKPRNISCFEEGMLIKRVVPVKIPVYDGINFREDNSYLGDCLEYWGIKDGKIYLSVFYSDDSSQVGKVLDLSYEMWQNGWDEYNDFELLERKSRGELVDKDLTKKFLWDISVENSN